MVVSFFVLNLVIDAGVLIWCFYLLKRVKELKKNDWSDVYRKIRGKNDGA